MTPTESSSAWTSVGRARWTLRVQTAHQESAIGQPGGFVEFFAALWGKEPFGWQQDLAQRVLQCAAGNGQEAQTAWPEAIALPTASGKTACMDIAVFALAVQAARLNAGEAITAPRRIFFVVDRRVIVDEAHERAGRLRDALKEAQNGVLKEVADGLRLLGHGENWRPEDLPLSVQALRGGIYRSESWVRNPLQPTIIASTVDQLGSRLLFRAYGRGPRTWPIYAGLAANDSLILLDEAHCAQPFLQTLQAVQRFREWAREPLVRCFHPVVMSATPPSGLDDVFRDNSDEKNDPRHPLGKRQLAKKPAKLHRVGEEITRQTAEKLTKEMVKELARSARELLGNGRQAVVVFVNRVATARETWRQLREDEENVDAILLTGRMRDLDKKAAVKRLKDLGLHSSNASARRLAKPTIVVATQTLEVGADLDFDGLVTECASLDALRQRFGRLNRMGRSVDARSAILMRADQAKLKKDDAHPVYGEALTETWKWLNEQADKNGEIDFGIAQLASRLPQGAQLSELNAPAPDAPVMLPAHVDCWAQTAPVPHPSPDIAPFLHGPQKGAADVRICWRADLDLRGKDSQDQAIESLRLCPPSSGEALPVPVGLFKRWLAGKEEEDYSPDLEGVDAADQAADQAVEDCRDAAYSVIRWQGAETGKQDVVWDPKQIRPGDLIVIPTGHPGSFVRLGDLPQDAPAHPDNLDVGDQAHRIARAKPILRLHPALVAAWPDEIAAKGKALDLLGNVEQRYESDPDEMAHEVHELLVDLAAAQELESSRWNWLPQAARELKGEFSIAKRPIAKLRRECRLVGQGLILVGRRRLLDLANKAGDFSDEDDATASGISHRGGQPVLLCEHLPGVEDFARRHAVGCGLPDALAEAVAQAGLLHDIGKADPRFQSLLRNGAPPGSQLLAKSAQMPKTQAASGRAHRASGYPKGGRHELLSVRLAESRPSLLPKAPILRDLVLHLVGSHHGHCRPFAPVVADDKSGTVKFDLHGHQMQWSGPTGMERLDSGAADRYWRLVRHYGWWGLAWLEALLRLADWRRSEWEEAHDAGWK